MMRRGKGVGVNVLCPSECVRRMACPPHRGLDTIRAVAARTADRPLLPAACARPATSRRSSGPFLAPTISEKNRTMQTTMIHSAETIRAHFAPESWQARFFESFHHDLSSKERIFPCTFGSLGSERGGLRFLFLDDFR